MAGITYFTKLLLVIWSHLHLYVDTGIDFLAKTLHQSIRSRHNTVTDRTIGFSVIPTDIILGPPVSRIHTVFSLDLIYRRTYVSHAGYVCIASSVQ